MKKFTKTTVSEEPRLVISYDGDSDTPREGSNLGYFITQDSRYNSPDEHPDFMEIIKETGEVAENCKDHMERIKKEINSRFNDEKVLAIYPICKYEHGGVAYYLGQRHGFDYSNNGFYIITEKSQKELGVKKKDFEQCIEDELKIYNSWVNGEVYQFILYDEKGEIEDSCGGFYDIEDIKEHLPTEWNAEDMTAYLEV